MKIRAGVVVLFLLAILPCAYAATETPLSLATPGDVAPPYRLRTAVASNGRGYVVTWEATADANSDVRSIYLRVLGADGVPLQPAPVLIGLGREPRAVWNGREYLVVWGITSPTTGSLPLPSVVGMRLREDGSFIDPQPVTLVSEMNPFSERVTVAWNGSEYLIAWTRGIFLVSADLQHSRLILIPSIGGVPTYAATSGDSFIVLTQANTGSGWQLNAVQMSATGAFGTVNVLNGTRGNIVPSGSGYAAMWDDETNLHFGRLRSDGSIVSSSIVAPGFVGFPRLATRDGRIVASWESIRNTYTNICTARFDAPGAPFCSAPSASLQHDPSIGTSATSVLAVWSDSINSRDSVRALMSPASGLPQVQAGGGRSISTISSTPAAEKRTDGSTWVAWSEYNSSTKHTEIRLGGKDSKGQVIADRAVFTGDVDQTSPAIAAGLSRTMALWEEGPADSPKIRMTIVDDATRSVIATLPLAAGSTPSVAFDGKEWLAAWQSTSGIIRFAIINSDGSVIASGAMPAETPNSSLQAAPAVAWSGKTFFVTWRETIAPASGLFPGERIEVATISTAGVASPSRTLDGAEGGLAAPSLAATGSRLLVSWGTPPATLRQMLFDDDGKQLSGFIDFAWPYGVSRTRTHAMPKGYAMFAVFAGSRIALTSADGRALDAFDVPDIAGGGDFAADADGRFDVVYSRSAGSMVATVAQTVGLPRRHVSGR